QWTISQLKARLELVTGIPPACQILLHEGKTELSDDNRTLEDYGIANYDSIIIKDTRPEIEQINVNDTSGVEKFELPKEQYELLDNSVLAWKRKNRLGRFGDTKEDEKPKTEESIPDHITIGVRCQVGRKRGTVRYVGFVPETPAGGVWVGVEYDEPVGKNNGTISGKSYFTTREKYGGFLRPDRVEIGNFPELSLSDDEEL
ncbi:Cell polarity protein alp11, partial [Neolecta irregularis DAH-3]